MRFFKRPEIEALFKETKVVLHIDNRYRGDIIKQLQKITSLDNEYSLEVKKKRVTEESTNKDYIWSMITKIAEKREREPVALYKELVKRHIPSNTVKFESMEDANRSKAEWEGMGIGYMVLHMTDYKEYIKCKRVRGLSGWNYKETEHFIKVLESECKSLGIEDKDATRVDKVT